MILPSIAIANLEDETSLPPLNMQSDTLPLPYHEHYV
jgi:hypothetical protein